MRWGASVRNSEKENKMILWQRSLTATSNCEDRDWERKKTFIQNEAFGWFDIPVSAQKIWVSLHNVAAKNRAKARVVLHRYNELDTLVPVVDVPSGQKCLSSEMWDKSLAKLIGKTVYVQVEYMG